MTPPDLAKTCRRKSAFKDPPDDAVRKAKARGVVLRYYPCPYCSHYHLTRKGMKQDAQPAPPKPRAIRVTRGPGRFEPGGALDRHLAKLRRQQRRKQ